MKELIIVVLIVVSASAFAQEREDVQRNSAGEVEYSDVKEVPDTKKEELFSRSQAWIAASFKSTQQVIQLADKELGRVVARGHTDFHSFTFGKVRPYGITHFQLTIDCKDGKYRAVLNQFVWKYPSAKVQMPIDKILRGQTGKRRNGGEVILAFDQDMLHILESLNKAMNTKSNDF
ncbi:MAG: DUF4468 domain-containing protein [Cytophagaceae bacterium]|nr:DUF4468 domain-containing protein [Cytophagaceae bacterium]